MLAHQLAAELERGMLRNTTDLVERAAPGGGTQDLAAEMERVARDAGGVGLRIGLRHHDLATAERLGGARLRGRARGDLDAELGFEIEDHLLGVPGAAREIDWYAAEHDDVAPGRRHLARRAHADVVRLL